MIAASTLFDGKGRLLNDTRIVVEGSQIVAIDPKAMPVDYDLRGLTVLPGWIDARFRPGRKKCRPGRNNKGGRVCRSLECSCACAALIDLYPRHPATEREHPT